MDQRQNFVVNGGIKLPIGYRFHPTDEELVLHYLRRQVLGVPLPASIIPELDVFQTDPWSLPGDLKEKRYFFTQKKGNHSHERKCKRTAAGSGYWRTLGKGKQIVASGTNHAVGIKTTLVFFQANSDDHEARTQWVMHEYRLLNLATIPNSTAKKYQMKLEDGWAVYSLFQRKRRSNKKLVGSMYNSSKTNNKSTPHSTNEVITCPSFMDFTVEESLLGTSPPQLSSPCSSGITEVSSNGLDQEEISSFH